MTLSELHALYGDDAMPDIEAELQGLDAPAQQRKAKRLKKLAVAAQSRIRRNTAWQMIEKWATKQGFSLARLRVERARFFHKQIVPIGASVPSRLAFFGEGTQPSDALSNMPTWGEFPAGTLVLLMGLPMLDVAVHTIAAIDRSQITYLPIVDKFMSAGRYRHKIDQSETIPVPLAALPSGGGAFVTNIRHESNGIPSAENRLVYDTPVVIDGARKFLSEILIDNGASGLGTSAGVELRVTLSLDVYYARQAG